MNHTEEISLSAAAVELGRDISTLQKWRRTGLISARFRNNKFFMKKSAVRKLKIAISIHGSLWPRFVEFTSDEKYEQAEQLKLPSSPEIEKAKTERIINMIDPKSDVESKSISLAKIAKELERLQERDLAAQVALKAVALM